MLFLKKKSSVFHVFSSVLAKAQYRLEHAILALYLGNSFLERILSLEQQLIERLQQLSPTHLDVVNESSGHGGYFPGKESHFKAVIVSDVFAGLRLVQRHQKIYAAAGDLLSPGKIHALAIHAFVPEEWKNQDTTSPECAHAPKA